MKCVKCSREINNSKFCPYCGTKAQNDDILIIGIVLIIIFPLVGIIFNLVKMSEEPRLKKVLKWYFIITIVSVIIFVAAMWFLFSGVISQID